MAASKIILLTGSILGSSLLSSCYMFDFFRRSHDDGTGAAGAEVLGDDLGAKANPRDEAALASVYAVAAVQPPAAVRPDPDLFARRLLRQFRPEGTTMARVIGDVENYRSLLGGASLDFQVAPANGYDATSVLAAMNVAEDICRALVSPSEWQHPGWQTILPAPPAEVRTNISFLAQRITGVATSSLSAAKLDQLEVILNGVNSDSDVDLSHYIAPCTALVLDAQAMLL